ncbi:MAG: AmmeMemoRadiSam system protein B, partial [Magnetospiraceae bacterium]
MFSGPIAASAYARLRPARGQITRVVLLGPCHRVAVHGLARSGAQRFRTPLGDIPVDRAAEERLAGLPQVSVYPETHRMEHSLEVHLPFLQRVLGDFTLVPLVVGAAAPDTVAEVLEALWGGPETLIVISSDLSHYLDYRAAKEIDGRAAAAIQSLNIPGLADDMACGRMPLKGLMTVAQRRGMRVETLDVRNSGDTAGSKDRVVGYGSWAFFEAEPATAPPPDFARQTRNLLATHGALLLKLAAASIRNGLLAGQPLSVVAADFHPDLQEKGACFVTLTKAGALRGCIGSPQGRRPLIEDLAENAYAAAFGDPRFPSVTSEELADLHLHLSVLSPAAPLAIASEADLLQQLRPGKDGLIIADGAQRALFLPSVWEQLPDSKTFLAHLKRKAGMAADHWSKHFKASRFITESVAADWRDLSVG